MPVIVGLGVLAVSFSLLVIYWSCIALVVEENVCGTATGMAACIENTGMVIYPIIIGTIYEATKDDEYHGYFWVQGFFNLLQVFALILSIGMMCVDKKYGSPLRKRQSAEVDEAEEGEGGEKEGGDWSQNSGDSGGEEGEFSLNKTDNRSV